MSGTLRNSRRLGPWLAIIGIVALAAAGCGSGNSDQSAQNAQEIKDQIQELQRYVDHRTSPDAAPHRGDGGKPGQGPYGRAPTISGGKLLPGGGLGVVSGAVLDPQTSAWTVTSHAWDTVVVAGGDARHPSDGLFSITRSSYIHGTQHGDEVGVPGSGPVTITKAPLGRKIVVSAQKHGDIEFKSMSGITGTLHLDDDTVTLNQ